MSNWLEIAKPNDIDFIQKIAADENTTYAKLQIQETLGKRNLSREIEVYKEFNKKRKK